MITTKQIKSLGIAITLMAAISISQAQSYYVAGGALTPTWTPDTNQMSGGPSVYTLTTATSTNFNEFKITDGTWNNTWPGSNAKINGDSNGSNTFYFYPGSFNDGWFPLANRVGYENPPGDSWELSGDFTSPNWGDDPTALMSTNSNGVFTVNYVLPSVGTHSFKFKIVGTWDGAVGQDFGMSSANISFGTVTPNQSVEFKFDPVNGRYQVNIPPVTNQVVFAVDMSAQIQLGNFDPSIDKVYVSGAFNNWPGTGTNALTLTNYPTYNGGNNTNIYYATNVFIGLPTSAGSEYKFTSDATAYSGSSYYEPRQANRSFNLMTTNGTLMLPVVRFGDAYASDYTAAGEMVTFAVNMTGATTTDGHQFDPANDYVFINGNFVSGGWAGWDPISLAGAGLQMANDPVGSSNYTYTAYLPADTLIKLDYKYGVLFTGETNCDNEAGFEQDHIRYLRTTTGNYTNSMDTFGNQYAEPSFGLLSSKDVGAGNVAVSWAGRPGVQLQVTTNLVSGPWQTLVETDGTNWNAGYNSANNGFMSQTNWPAMNGQEFFRLIQTW